MVERMADGRQAWPLLAVLALLGLAAATPLLAPYDPVRMDVAHRLALPSAAHWLGQDEYGREVLTARTLDYVEAARALGARPERILLRTVLPNVIGPITVQFSLTVASAIVLEAGLSFLGLGVVPPAPSWGLMIRGARSYMEQNPLGLLWPCI